MRKALQDLISSITKFNVPQRKKKRKSRGQSLVEVAISFPVLIMLFTGVVEFGFILNFYLSLLDATRDAARLYSGGDPFVWNTDITENPHGEDQFYYETAYMVERTLDPRIDDVNYRGRRILLDPTIDDVVVSVYGAKDSTVTLRRDDGSYHLFPTPGHTSGNYPSIFTAQNILNARVSDAPNAGILLVEVHYNYHHVLSLPWMTVFLPNPLHLQAYTIMPIRAAEPK